MRLSKTLLVVFLTLVVGDIFAQFSIPVFANKRDSAEYFLVTEAIQEIFKERQTTGLYEESSAKFDSLIRVQNGFRDKIIAYRIVYKPAPGFTTFKDLKNGKIKPQDVTQLSFNGKQLVSIPPEVYSCINLKELEFVNTSLKKLPSKLSKLTHLQNIYVFNNSIQGKLKLGRNANIRKLTIQGTNAIGLPKSYKNFSGLDSLELSRNNGMTAFPVISKNKRLVKLNLIENDLTLTDLKKGNLSLQELNLQKNKIVVVPKAIEVFPNLKKLQFNYNQITDIDPAIGNLKKLEFLSLYQNKLTDIPSGIYELSNLKTIDLYFNLIRHVDPAISKLTNLRVLYLSNNKLTNLPENIGSLSNLQELYIHDNGLGILPESMKELKQLRVLRLNNNYLTAIPGSLLTLSELENLDISRNYIYKFPLKWESLSKLQMLGIIGNPFENKEDVGRVAESLRARGTICNYTRQ